MNTVHMEVENMNKAVTSKQELITTAIEIAQTEGIQKVSIRNIAHKRSISVGVLYNYFPTKADLIFAVVSDFWSGVLQELSALAKDENSFLDFVSIYYGVISKRLSDFESGWLTQMDVLSPEEKQRGKEMEHQCFKNLKALLTLVLNHDGSILRETWTTDYQQDAFIEFLFLQMMGMLRNGQQDCSFLCQTIRRILY